jgi:predicted PurR-regulated permease PerM
MDPRSRWHTHGRYPYLLAKYVGAILIAGIVLALMYRLRVVIIPVLFAGFLAFLLHRPTDWLSKRIPRSIAAGVMVVMALLLVAALVLLIAPTLFAKVAALLHRLPDMLDAVDRGLSPWVEENLGVSLHVDRAVIQKTVQEHAKDLAAPSGWVLSRVFSSAITVALAAVNAVIVVVFSYYILVSHESISARAMDLVPARFREHVRTAVDAVDEALSRFVLGQITVCLILGFIYALALTIIGIDGGAIIGVIAGLVGFVPYLGIVTGLALSLLAVGLDYGGPGQVIAVLVTFGVVPVLDTTVITPNIVGGRVGLSPFVVIVALLVGAELLGFLGVLLALPTAAVLRALLRIGLARYRETRFYRGEGEVGGDKAE